MSAVQYPLHNSLCNPSIHSSVYRVANRSNGGPIQRTRIHTIPIQFIPSSSSSSSSSALEVDTVPVYWWLCTRTHNMLSSSCCGVPRTTEAYDGMSLIKANKLYNFSLLPAAACHRTVQHGVVVLLTHPSPSLIIISSRNSNNNKTL